jgi:hypothetical protein
LEREVKNYGNGKEGKGKGEEVGKGKGEEGGKDKEDKGEEGVKVKKVKVKVKRG